MSKFMGCHKINLPEGFVCNRVLSIILLKQICLFTSFLSLSLSQPLVCQILIFYFTTLIQISFLIFIAKLMLISPSFPFTKNVTIFFFSLHFFICYMFILQLVFFQNAYYYEPKRIFFMDIQNPFTFFMVKKCMKSNHDNLLLLNY